MSGEPSGAQYKPGAIALHWLMLALIVSVYACILLRENYPRGSDIREALKTWHFMLGLSVLSLVIVRLALHILVWKAPAITPPPPVWQMILARLVHVALYALMILMPIGGWLILSGEGDPVPFWGLTLPPLMGVNEPLAKQIEGLHETGGTVGYFLIGLHAAAALFHHYIVKDDTLLRMLPRRR